MKALLLNLAAMTLATIASLAQATDVPTKDGKGLKDPPGLPRYSGSVLFAVETVDFDELKAPVSKAKYASEGVSVSAPKVVEASGQRWRAHYVIPDGRSPLEVVRNYQSQLKAQGFSTVYECVGDECGDRADEYTSGAGSDAFLNLVHPRSEWADIPDTHPIACSGGAFMGDLRYAVLKNEKSGELLVLFTRRAGIVASSCPEEEWKKHLYATVVYVRPKTMETAMETIKASDLDKAISETGKVAIYGILFDTASATIKPESRASLDEIAKLLKKDAKLGLHIVGHTDAQGALPANFDLSKRRAEAVKAALVKDYAIAGSRLTANGVASLAPVAPNTSDEGRAKNRRVELVPF